MEAASLPFVIPRVCDFLALEGAGLQPRREIELEERL
jgi:hypothetical protein